MEKYPIEKAQKESAQIQEKVKSSDDTGYDKAEKVIEKEVEWKKKRAEIDEIGDVTGHGIDEKIKETVVAFNINKLSTSNSCEGHVDHGLPYPFVEISAEGEPEWKYEGQKELFEQIAHEKEISLEKLNRNSPEWDVLLYEEVDSETGRKINEISENELQDTYEYSEWKTENKKVFLKTQELLAEYRDERGENVDADTEIIMDGNEETNFMIRSKAGFSRGVDGMRYIEERSMDDWELSAEEELDLRVKLEKRRDEMSKFTEFLRNKYFEDKK